MSNIICVLYWENPKNPKMDKFTKKRLGGGSKGWEDWHGKILYERLRVSFNLFKKRGGPE